MTTLTTAPADTDSGSSPAPRRWRKVGLIGGCVLLVAALGTGLGFWRYAATYSPLDGGSYFGPYGSASQHIIAQHQTDLGQEFYIKGPAGTEASVIVGLANTGSHDVTVQRIERNYLVAKTAWSPHMVRPGGNIEGQALPLRPFPASIPAHRQIRVVITLRKPPCRNRPIANLSQLAVHWHALGVGHTFQWNFVSDETFVGCPLHPH